jgi:hypothetical protein
MSAASRPRPRRWIAAGVLLGSALVAWYAKEKAATGPALKPPATRRPQTNAAPGALAPMVEGGLPNALPDAPLALSRPWGSDDQSLGRSRPQEGNPEAPMSFAMTKDGNLVVLDQVNARVVQIDRTGRTVATTELTERVPQDIALGPGGETAILDRLGDQTVTLRDPKGNVIGRLPLRGQGVPEPGQVTGVFIDKKDVYVERRHGPLVLVGDLEGHPARERTEVPGRPTRDGALFISAGIVDRRAGRMFVSAFDRRLGGHRFTREITTGAPLRSIALLDSDRRGTIYVGVLLETAPGDWQRVYCMAPQHGEPQGQMEMPGSNMPEETLRDMAVMDDGGVVVTELTEQGIRYLEHHCQ